jgi:uncharacterized protein (DUF1501 family)
MFTSTFQSDVCRSTLHFNRRTLLKAAGLSGIGWLTPLAQVLGRQAETGPSGKPAKSVILVWLQGGPSQLETFDPHPGSNIAAGTEAIKTNVEGIQLAKGLEQVAEQMDSLSIIRSVTSKEGDHERAVYNIKTGYRPDPTLIHPAIGSVICHQTLDKDEKVVEIPRHISILSANAPSRGGYLGAKFDAFKVNDPKNPINDLSKRVAEPRFDQRLQDLENFVEAEFAQGRGRNSRAALARLDTTNAAVKMMTSEQLKAFDLQEVPESLLGEFGDSAFGRGCLAAIRLIEVGVRCVEVTLNGWDSHANNHEIQKGQVEILDPALAALVRNLKARGLYEDTIVLCGGEFGRTPTVNPAGGRDHWPHGFSIALGGGGLKTGQVIGETSPTPFTDPKKKGTDVIGPRPVEDIHATILNALGIDFSQMIDTPIDRPMRISEGKVIDELAG